MHIGRLATVVLVQPQGRLDVHGSWQPLDGQTVGDGELVRHHETCSIHSDTL